MTMDQLGDMRLFVEAAQRAACRRRAASSDCRRPRRARGSPSSKKRCTRGCSSARRASCASPTKAASTCSTAASRCKRIDDAEAALQAGQNVVRGKVRISATSDFGRNLLRDWLDEFNALLSGSDVRADAVGFGVESVAGGHRSGDSLRRAARQRARRAQARAEPARAVRVAGLSRAQGRAQRRPPISTDHDFIVLVTASRAARTSGLHARRRARSTTRAGRSRLGNQRRRGDPRVGAARATASRIKSIWDIAADVRAGTLKMLLPRLVLRTRRAVARALSTRNRYMAPRVRVLLDFLVERFATGDGRTARRSGATRPTPRRPAET